MRAIIYGIIWAIITTLVCYYIYNLQQKKIDQSSKNDNVELVEIVNEVDSESTEVDHTEDVESADQYEAETSEEGKSNNDSAEITESNTEEKALDEQSESPINSNKETISFDDFLEKAYIEFNPNSTRLPKNDQFDQYLDSVANIMLNEDYEIVLIGHADNSNGRDQSNYEIGLKRAEFIQSLLTSKNVSKEKIKVISEGDSSPRVSGNTPEAKTLNRRVELFIKQKN